MSSTSRGAAEQRELPWPVFYKGQQIVVRARDKFHAKLAVYVSHPESKWKDLR